MLNQNITQRGIQITGLDIVIGRCSPDSQQERPDRHPAKVETQTQNMDEDNQQTLHWYFRSNPTLRGYRKIMIEIWKEWASFKTSQNSLTKLGQ